MKTHVNRSHFAHWSEQVRPWLNWVLVLPAAIGAALGVQLVIALNGLAARQFFDSDISYEAQFASAFLVPAAFVSAGSRVAPAYRHITAICLTVLVAILQTVVATRLVIENRVTISTLAWLIICGVAGIAACLYECHAFYRGEPTGRGRGSHESLPAAVSQPVIPDKPVRQLSDEEMLREIADLAAKNKNLESWVESFQQQCKWHRKLVDYLASQLTEAQLAGLDETTLLQISEWVPSRAVLDACRAAKRKGPN